MAGSTKSDYLTCSICLDDFTEPVSLSCGHTFCHGCISSHWSAVTPGSELRCPQCRAGFGRAAPPPLCKNVAIAGLVVEKRERSGRAAGPGDADGKRVRRHGHDGGNEECPELLSSFKETLMQRELTLTTLISDLQQEEVATEVDFQESLSVVSSGFSELLRLVREEESRAVGGARAERDSALAGLRLQRHNCGEALQRVRGAIGDIDALQATRGDAHFVQGCKDNWQRFVSLLNEEPGRLPSREGRFSSMRRHQERIAQLLSFFGTSGQPSPRTPSPPPPPPPPLAEGGTAMPGGDGSPGRASAALSSVLETRRAPEAEPSPLLSAAASLPRRLSQRDASADRPGKTELRRRYGCSPLLDPDSAHRWLCVSEDRLSVKTSSNNKCADLPTRFDFKQQVAGSSSFSRGRHYWEVDTGAARWWRVGVAYGAMSRRGNSVDCWLGENATSWCFQSSLVGRHRGNDAPTADSVASPLRAVGVFLDLDAGIVEFYGDGSERPLCSYECGFSGELLPVLELPGFLRGSALSVVRFE